MARLIELLAYARLSDRRSASQRGSFGAVTLLMGVGGALALAAQLRQILFGEVVVRVHAAETLIFALTLLWFLLALSGQSSLSEGALRRYPLTGRQRMIYRLVSPWQNLQTAGVAAASLLTLLALLRVPAPGSHVVKATLLFGSSVLAGSFLSFGAKQLSTRSHASSAQQRGPERVRFCPLFRKEMRYFSRTLDPWIGLIISLALGYSESLAAWLTPAKLSVPLILIAMVQLPAIVNPFALETAVEVERYRLMPISAWRICGQKHGALVVILLLSLSPLLAAVLVKMHLRETLASVLVLLILVASWACTGVVLMRQRLSRNIKMSFGTLSCTGFSFPLFGLAVVLLSTAPAMAAFLLRGGVSKFSMIGLGGFLVLLCALYAVLLPASSAVRLRLH